MRKISKNRRSTTTAGNERPEAATKKLVIERETLREVTGSVRAENGDLSPCSSSRTEI